jgi:hypothetical protein
MRRREGLRQGGLEYTVIIAATQEAGIGRIVGLGQLG